MANRIKIFDAPFSGSRIDNLQRKRYVNGVLTNYTVFEFKGELAANGQLRDFGPNAWHMTKQGSTPITYPEIGIPRADGNLWQPIYLGGAYSNNARFYLATPAALATAMANNFTLTIVRIHTSLNSSANISTYQSGSGGRGFIVYSGRTYFYSPTGAGSVFQDVATVPVGQLSIYQGQLNNGIYSGWSNGVAGTPVDVSAYLSAGPSWFIGADGVGGVCNGSLLYMRLDSEVLSADDLSADRAALSGFGAYVDGRLRSPTFVRSGTKTLEVSNRKIYTMPTNYIQPIGSEGGMLFEGIRAGFGTARNNRLFYSQALNNWPMVGAPTMNAVAFLAPDNTQSGAQVTVTGSTDYIRQTATSFTNAISIAPSFWIKKISTSGTLIIENDVSATYGKWELPLSRLPDNEWLRITVQNLAIYGGTEVAAWVCQPGTTAGVKFYGKDVGVAITFGLWGCQLENDKASTSYMPTTNGVASLGVDSISYLWPREKIPGVGYGYQYKKILMEIEVKKTCIWRALNASNSYPLVVTSSTTNKSFRFFIPSAGGTTSFQFEFRDTPNSSVNMAFNLGEWDDQAWHKLAVYFDLIRVGNSWIGVDGRRVSLTGNGQFDRFLAFDANSRITPGLFAGSSPSHCWVRNARIYLFE